MLHGEVRQKTALLLDSTSCFTGEYFDRKKTLFAANSNLLPTLALPAAPARDATHCRMEWGLP